MTRQDLIRTKLARKLFSTTRGIGKSVTLTHSSSPVMNTRGEQDSATLTAATVVIVPYDQTTQRSFESFGPLKPGDLEAAVPYDVSISIGDTISMEGDVWYVMQVAPNWLPDNVVTIIRMSRNTA